MEEIERLASFYLGQEYDLATGQALDKLVHYDARDLTTHAVCVGMTGSGKTGLGIIVLEEAALDGVPSLVIDPKGDMTNLLLTFPDLLPEDFRPWVNPDDARRKNMDLDAFAAKTAETWRDGLAKSGEGPDRIRRLKAAADFSVYTPGSSAGRQLSILHTFDAPALSWDDDAELIRDRIESVASALLALIGVEADPVRSREFILLSNIVENAWRRGESLDLAQLIVRIQNPPFTQLGVFPIDTFYPEKERMELALMLNGLLASPTFASWIQGDPLDIGKLLYGPGGKPQVSVLYIAHLSDAERTFFLTLLLDQVVSWVRAQSGTTSLRALLYMDELFGFLPPHPGNPPTKKPLLTLLKQARAFGLGLMLCTQNPVDLDYKALANAGTWFIGRMQTDRDKQRLLDGLEGVQLATGGLTRSDFDRLISAMKSRVFLFHSVHAPKPVVFSTRFAMSYLRGPLTIAQIRELVGPPAVAPAAEREKVPAATTAQRSAPPAAPPPPPAAPELPYGRVPPQLPSAVRQVYLPVQRTLEEALAELARDRGWTVKTTAEQAGILVYEAALVGQATLHYSHTQSRQAFTDSVSYLTPVQGEAVDWSDGAAKLGARDLGGSPKPEAHFADVPAQVVTAKGLAALQKDFEEYLYFNANLTIRHNPSLALYSKSGELESAFQKRCREAAEKGHDAELKKLRTQYKAKLDRLEDKRSREERELEADKAEYSARKQEEVLSGAESLVSLFAGRKRSTRISTATRKRRMTRESRAEVEESEQALADLDRQIEELEEEAKRADAELADKWNEKIDDVQVVEIRPTRANIQVTLFAVAWLPRWEVTVAGQTLSLPAYEVQR